MQNRRGGKRQQYIRPFMPGFVEFQHPKLVTTPPNSEAWLHEIKFDGYRIQMRVERGTVRIFTRNGFDWTGKFPEIAGELAAWPDCILDGELCALDKGGRPTFSGLRASISPGRTAPLVVFLFDCLWRGEEDLRPFALATRKGVLYQLLEEHGSERLRGVGALPSGGAALLTSACRMELEGIVSKRLDAPYRSGRGDAWVKSKCRPSQEVVIGGFVQEPLGVFKALLVGVYEDGRLRYAGSVKTGLTKAKGLVDRLHELETDRSPFDLESPRKTREIRWVRPVLVANIDIAEWTASGKLRQSSFKGLREDKRPEEVVRERPVN